EMAAERRLACSGGGEGSCELQPGASTVIITLEPAPGGTTIRLVHEGLAGEQADNHAAGWNHYLGRLTEAAAKGDAGPDEWGAAPPHLDALTCAGATLAVCERVLLGGGEAAAGRATACTEFPVAQLADPLIGSITAIGGAAGAAFPAGTPATLEARVADPAQVALEAWDGRGPEGTVAIGDSDIPAAVALGILSIELLVHAWDFAQATGQHVAVPDPVTAYVLEAAHKIITPEGRRRVGFDPELPADPDAGILERLIAFTGRPQDTGRPRPT